MLDIVVYTFFGLMIAGFLGILGFGAHRILWALISDWKKATWRGRIFDAFCFMLVVGVVGFFVIATLDASINH